MAVLRIVANLASPDPAKSRAFYEDFLGLNVAMDLGWIVTFAAPATKGVPQVRTGNSRGLSPDRRALGRKAVLREGSEREDRQYPGAWVTPLSLS
jgi:catechol 2,3-dioxygenase-like lactoylglutathione lyase family enzyme